MKIEQVELFRIHMPYVAPFETSFGRAVSRETVLVRVTADGVVGWGESVGDGPGYSYETVQTVWHILRDHLIPELFRAPIAKPTDCVERFKYVRGHNMAKAAIEDALWDIAAQQAGLSLRDYIGKVSGHKKLQDSLVVGVSIGIQESPKKLVEKILSFRQFGYTRIKIKIKPGKDLQYARAARKAIPGVQLMVDANSAYSLSDAEVFKKMEDLDLLMIEQPLDYNDIYEHHKLQKQLRTPICLDESIHTPADATFAIELGACKIINIKQGRVGGLTQAIRVHDICMQNNIPVWCGGMLETGIGRALNLALAALPNFKLPGDISASNRYYHEDLVDPAFEIKDGKIVVPKGKGLGVNVIMDRVVKATSVHEVYRPSK